MKPHKIVGTIRNNNNNVFIPEKPKVNCVTRFVRQDVRTYNLNLSLLLFGLLFILFGIMTSEEDKTKTNLAIENLKSQLNESERCAEKLMSLRNPDLDKLNTVFDKIDQEHKTLIDSMIDNCVDSTLIAAVTHNKFEFDTRREEWFLKIRGSFCDDANLPSSSKPGPNLLSSKAPSECSRASNSSSKSSNVSSTSSRISMKRLRAREKLNQHN